jgi:serine/threonine protein kinase/tetratricopeptide (TPR) repeat protein
VPLPDAKEEAIFNAAREIDAPEARRLYIQQSCGNDRALQARVEGLLRMLDEERDFLESPVAGVRAAVANLVSEGPGTRIGPYQLLEQIGEGGFGVVFLAEQHHPVCRRVALKVLKPGMDTRQVVARFEAERQALALMDHPHIARVLDGGETVSGRPYFVMELVRGVPITDFCDQNHLSVRQRLELFVGVCQAVQHAHQKGIIHRDLKPSNVLVTRHDDPPPPALAKGGPGGVVKVIDFGVAKAVGQKLTDKTLVTNFSHLVGTPLYMSPEQAEMSGLDIDTRTDVYALGVLLYELLTGKTPFDRERLATVAFDEVRRIIREEEPARPSARITMLAAAARTVSGNRRSDPKRLRRLFRGELDWIVMKCLEKDRTRRYETAGGLARDVERYLRDEPVEASPPGAGYRLRKFVKRNKGQVVAAGLVFSALLAGMAGTTWGMIRAEHARQDAVSAQLAEAKRAEGERRAKEEAQKRLAQIERGTETLASVIQDLDPLAAEKEGVTLRVLLGRRLGEAAQQLEGEAVGDPLVVARLQHVLGISLHELGHQKQAEAVLVKACRTRERLLGADNFDTLATKHHLAMLYRAQGKYPLAETLYKEVLEIRTAKLGADDPDTLHSQQHLAMLYHSQGKFDFAETLCKEVLERRIAKLGADHPDTLHSQHRLAMVYRSQGNYAQAESLCKEVLQLRTGKLGADHLDTLASKHLLAVLYRAQERHALAEPLYKEVLELRTAKLGPDHPDTLGTRHHLALVYWSMDKVDLSIPLLEETVKLRKAKLGPDHPSTLATKVDLGRNYCDAGRLTDGIALLEEAQQKLKGRDYPRPWWVAGALLKAYVRSGKTAEATAMATEHVRAARKQFPTDSPELGAALADAGRALLELKAYAVAEPLLGESLSIGERHVPDAWGTHHARSLLGGALLGQQKFADAEPLLVDGYAGMKGREAQIPKHAEASLTQALERLVLLYDTWGRPSKAAEWRKRLGEQAPGPQR